MSEAVNELVSDRVCWDRQLRHRARALMVTMSLVRVLVYRNVTSWLYDYTIVIVMLWVYD